MSCKRKGGNLCARLKIIDIQQLGTMCHTKLDPELAKPAIKNSLGTILKILIQTGYLKKKKMYWQNGDINN